MSPRWGITEMAKRYGLIDPTCEVTPDGWCATHSDSDGPFYCIPVERITLPDAYRSIGGAEDERCRRCGGPNFVWSAPSPLWNLVMRGNDINGPIQFSDLVCVGCFMALATKADISGRWRVSVDPEPEGLVKVTPSGRVWNEETWLWEEPPSVDRYGEEVADILFEALDRP